MTFRQELQPDDIDALCGVLEGYCLSHGILGERERNDVGAALIALFQTGNQTSDMLRKGIEARRDKDNQARAARSA